MIDFARPNERGRPAGTAAAALVTSSGQAAETLALLGQILLGDLEHLAVEEDLPVGGADGVGGVEKYVTARSQAYFH